MKTLFSLLKLIPAFQKLLNEFFEGERAELKQQIDDWQRIATSHGKDAMKWEAQAQENARQADSLRLYAQAHEKTIETMRAEIQELRNATTKKLQAIDSLDSESVFNATLYSPRSTPRS